MGKSKGIRISPTNSERLLDARKIKKDAVESGVYDVIKIIPRGMIYKLNPKVGYKQKVPVFEVRGFDTKL